MRYSFVRQIHQRTFSFYKILQENSSVELFRFDGVSLQLREVFNKLDTNFYKIPLLVVSKSKFVIRSPNLPKILPEKNISQTIRKLLFDLNVYTVVMLGNKLVHSYQYKGEY
jgi:hypothetical protein